MVQFLGMRGLSVVVLIIVVATSAVLAANSPDGLPRPNGYPRTPTREYGSTPPCLDSTNTRVDCEWYGFAHVLYPETGAQCLITTRQVLSNTSFIGILEPYEYYYLRSQVFDSTTNTSYCLYGCFNMGSSSATPPTSAGFAPPPPSTSVPPSPVFSAPPPPSTSVPPSPVFSAPPPPPLFTSPPPPGLTAPPTMAPPDSTPPGAAVPPQPPRSGFFNLSGAGLLRPVSGIVSLVVSGALLVLNFLVC